jgi:protein TonB
MSLPQDQRVNLKVQYPLVLRISLVISLLFIIVMFATIPKSNQVGATQNEIRIEIETIEIPIIEQQIEAAKPPSRPSIPVEVDDDELLDDVTIEGTTDISSYEAWEAPPPPPAEQDEDNGPRIRFIPYDEPPEPIGGFTAIQRNIVYPEIAQ